MNRISDTPPPSATPTVSPASPFIWLRQGWADLMANPIPGLTHGLVMALFGSTLLWLAHDRFWWLAGAFSGFLIVAPILASGLYVISRERAQGRRAGLAEVWQLWHQRDGRLVRFGLLLALAGTGWVLTSAALITAWAPAPVQQPLDFLRLVVLAPQPGLFEAWLLLGALLAAPVFASSVLAIPLLVDTDRPLLDCVRASWRAVALYPLPLAIWALCIALMVGLGMLTAMLGLVLVVPWLGHASWHAYAALRDESLS
jgi:uncharacterized membrane protein